jgi:hypothetical protein
MIAAGVHVPICRDRSAAGLRPDRRHENRDILLADPEIELVENLAETPSFRTRFSTVHIQVEFGLNN